MINLCYNSSILIKENILHLYALSLYVRWLKNDGILMFNYLIYGLVTLSGIKKLKKKKNSVCHLCLQWIHACAGICSLQFSYTIPVD